MAKLEFCRHAVEIRAQLDEGRHAEATKEVVRLLRQGYASRQFLAVVADMLDAPPRKRGRPKLKTPPKWLEIGIDFEEMVAGGASYEAARQVLAERYARSESSVAEAVRYFREARTAADIVALEDGTPI